MPLLEGNDTQMANGNFFGDIKSRLGRFGSGQGNSRDQREYDDYAEYDEYSADFAEYDEYDDYDPYMDRNPVTSRGAKSDPGLPRLVSMDDARASAREIPRDSSRDPHSSSIRSYGRMMVDSSLPPSMTAEGTAASSAAANRRTNGGGLDSLFGSSSSSSNVVRDSMQLSMPGMRRLQVIKPTKYDDAEEVATALKDNDVAILVLSNVDSSLMMRLLDFSFGAASALDASVESIGHKVFAICRSVGLDDRERADLASMGII